MVRRDGLQMGDRVGSSRHTADARARRSANIGDMMPDWAWSSARWHQPALHWRIFDEIRQLGADTVAQLVRHIILAVTGGPGPPRFSHSRFTASASPYIPNIGGAKRSGSSNLPPTAKAILKEM